MTLADFRRTFTLTMPAGFDTTFRKVQELVADFTASEKFQDFYPNRCDGLPLDFGIIKALHEPVINSMLHMQHKID